MCLQTGDKETAHTSQKENEKTNASASFVWNAWLTIHKSRFTLSQCRIWMRKRINGVFSQGHQWLKWQGRERRRKNHEMWLDHATTRWSHKLSHAPKKNSLRLNLSRRIASLFGFSCNISGVARAPWTSNMIAANAKNVAFFLPQRTFSARSTSWLSFYCSVWFFFAGYIHMPLLFRHLYYTLFYIHCSPPPILHSLQMDWRKKVCLPIYD